MFLRPYSASLVVAACSFAIGAPLAIFLGITDLNEDSRPAYVYLSILVGMFGLASLFWFTIGIVKPLQKYISFKVYISIVQSILISLLSLGGCWILIENWILPHEGWAMVNYVLVLLSIPIQLGYCGILIWKGQKGWQNVYNEMRVV